MSPCCKYTCRLLCRLVEQISHTLLSFISPIVQPSARFRFPHLVTFLLHQYAACSVHSLPTAEWIDWTYITRTRCVASPMTKYRHFLFCNFFTVYSYRVPSLSCAYPRVITGKPFTLRWSQPRSIQKSCFICSIDSIDWSSRTGI
jgi:hypothetical protein